MEEGKLESGAKGDTGNYSSQSVRRAGSKSFVPDCNLNERDTDNQTDGSNLRSSSAGVYNAGRSLSGGTEFLLCGSNVSSTTGFFSTASNFLDSDFDVKSHTEGEGSADEESLSVQSLPAYVSEHVSIQPSCAVSEQNLLDRPKVKDGTQLFYANHHIFDKLANQQDRRFHYQGNANYPMRRSRSLHGEYFLDRNFRRPSQHTRRLPRSFRESISDSSSQESGEHRAIGDNLLVVICLGLLTFTSMASMSIIAPFFPNEASQKGMTETVSGLVFAVYGLVVVIMSPIVGKIIPYLGLRFVLLSGILLNGVANILFGLLDQTQGGLFTFFSFTIRGVEALGAASTSTACFTYLMQMFPQYIGTAFGIIETCVGLGMSLGPAIGGFLYTLGGYSLPFFALGILVLANIPFCWYIIKPIEDFSDDSKSSSSTLSLPAGKSTYWSLISIPSVFVVCLVIVVVSSCLGFLDPTVEPHFRQYEIGAQMVGLVFLVMSASYAIFSPVVGYIAGKTAKKFSIMFVGLVVTALGLLIVGPSPFTGIDPGPWISTAGMLVIGLANAIAFIPTFETIILIAIQRGFQDDVTTYGLVSGLWSSMNALGDTIGPALGGFLFENFGFPQSATIMAWCCLTVAVLVLCVCCCITEKLLLSKSTSSIADTEGGDDLLPDGCLPNSCTLRADGTGSSLTTKDANYESSFLGGYQALDYDRGSTKYNFNRFTDEDVSLGRKLLRSGVFSSQSGFLTGSTEKSKLLPKDVNSRHYGSNDPNV